jgi:hypothetical protein
VWKVEGERKEQGILFYAWLLQKKNGNTTGTLLIIRKKKNEGNFVVENLF